MPHKLLLDQVLAAQGSSSQRVVVENVCNKSPIVSENTNIPPDESNFSIAENDNLLLVGVLAIKLLCLLFYFLRVLEYILELDAAVTSLLLSFVNNFFVRLPKTSFFAVYFGFLFLNHCLVSALSKPLLLVKNMVQLVDFVHSLSNTF